MVNYVNAFPIGTKKKEEKSWAIDRHTSISNDKVVTEKEGKTKVDMSAMTKHLMSLLGEKVSGKPNQTTD